MADALVVGGGIAGVSSAYALAGAGASVTLVEQEASLAYHTTGRSAALFFENYGAGPVRPLTKASRPFMVEPPDGLVDAPLLTERGGLTIARPDQMDRLTALYEEGRALTDDVHLLDPEGVAERCPAVRPGYAAAGLWEPEAKDLDVAGLHQAFVRGLRRRGGEIVTSAPVRAARRRDRRWEVAAGERTISAGVLVNAAGAWGDVVAGLAGAAPVGLVPKRRTAFMVAAPEGSSAWPMTIGADHEFYFKPDGPQLLCSPADETPSEPCDARPEEVDVALAIERINAATTLEIRHVRSQWAGLRTFAPDGGMVIGFDPVVDGFFWLVGQGGTGIQTAPAAGRLTADLITTGAPSEELVAAGLDLDELAPRSR